MHMVQYATLKKGDVASQRAVGTGADRLSDAEQFETGSKKGRGRGMAQQSIDLIRAMYTAAEAAQPINGGGAS
jgi:hypothetical protein